MIYHARRLVSAFAAGLLLALATTALAADPEIDGMLRSPVGKDWVTNGGNLTHSSPHFFDGIKESGDHGGGFEKNRGVSADGRFLRIHPDDSPAPR